MFNYCTHVYSEFKVSAMNSCRLRQIQHVCCVLWSP